MKISTNFATSLIDMKSNTQREQNVERGSDDENIRGKPWKKNGKNNDYKGNTLKDKEHKFFFKKYLSIE